MSLITKADSNRIMQAVQEAELNCSGEIRVHVQKRSAGDIQAAAEAKFNELKMYETEQQNGVLIFVAVKDRKFAIIGDEGIHKKVSDEFWQKTAEAMTSKFVKGDIAGGIAEGVLAAGEQLKKFFPYQSDDVNELNDEVSIDETV